MCPRIGLQKLSRMYLINVRIREVRSLEFLLAFVTASVNFCLRADGCHIKGSAGLAHELLPV